MGPLAIENDTLKHYDTQACPWKWDSHGKRPMGWDGMGQHTFVFPMRQ